MISSPRAVAFNGFQMVFRFETPIVNYGFEILPPKRCIIPLMFDEIWDAILDSDTHLFRVICRFKYQLDNPFDLLIALKPWFEETWIFLLLPYSAWTVPLRVEISLNFSKTAWTVNCMGWNTVHWLALLCSADNPRSPALIWAKLRPATAKFLGATTREGFIILPDIK